jgi:hypothetical protein
MQSGSAYLASTALVALLMLAYTCLHCPGLQTPRPRPKLTERRATAGRLLDPRPVLTPRDSMFTNGRVL